MNNGKNIVYPIISLSALLLLWQAASAGGIVNRSLFPAPTDVAGALLALAASGELLMHVNASIWRVFAGLFLGSLFGIATGLLTGRVKAADSFFSPLLNIFRSFPPVAIIPLVIVWFGIGDSAKIFSISFAVFFPVWISTHMGASRIPVNYLRAAALLTKSKTQIVLKAILPASMPSIVTGIRLGIASAFIMVFVSELAAASRGIGYLITVSNYAFRMDVMIAALFVLGFLGAITDYIFIRTVKRCLPWLEKGWI